MWGLPLPMKMYHLNGMFNPMLFVMIGYLFTPPIKVYHLNSMFNPTRLGKCPSCNGIFMVDGFRQVMGYHPGCYYRLVPFK